MKYLNSVVDLGSSARDIEHGVQGMRDLRRALEELGLETANADATLPSYICVVGPTGRAWINRGGDVMRENYELVASVGQHTTLKWAVRQVRLALDVPDPACDPGTTDIVNLETQQGQHELARCLELAGGVVGPPKANSPRASGFTVTFDPGGGRWIEVHASGVAQFCGPSEGEPSLALGSRPVVHWATLRIRGYSRRGRR